MDACIEKMRKRETLEEKHKGTDEAQSRAKGSSSTAVSGTKTATTITLIKEDQEDQG
jgi:hypothetical protein